MYIKESNFAGTNKEMLTNKKGPFGSMNPSLTRCYQTMSILVVAFGILLGKSQSAVNVIRTPDIGKFNCICKSL